MKTLKVGRITAEQILNSERAIRREIEIENNLNICHHRVHRSKKTYSRKEKYRGREF
jgi:hypothetical protein